VTEAATRRISRKLGLAAGFVALAALPALGLGAFAAADTGTGEAGTGEAATQGPGGMRPARPQLTDEQRQCLANEGVTLPERPANPGTGERPQPPSDEQRAAFRAAAAACNLPIPATRGPCPVLTDEQRQCLANQGVTLPERPANPGTGERPQPPSDEQRAAFRAAAAACGIELPAHGPRGAPASQGAEA
jgi:hypothetical protein